MYRDNHAVYPIASLGAIRGPVMKQESVCNSLVMLGGAWGGKLCEKKRATLNRSGKTMKPVRGGPLQLKPISTDPAARSLFK